MNRKFKLWMKAVAVALVVAIAYQALPLQAFAAKKDTFTYYGTEEKIRMPEDYEPVLPGDRSTYTLDAGRCGTAIYQDKTKSITMNRTDMSLGGSRMGISIDWLFGGNTWRFVFGYELSINKSNGVVCSLRVSNPNSSYTCDQKSAASDGTEVWSSASNPEVKVYVKSGIYGAVIEGKQFTYDENGILIGIIDARNEDTVQISYNPDGTYKEIQDAAGRKYQFTYTVINGKPQITKIAVADVTIGGKAASVTYSYVTVNDRTQLHTVTYPDGLQAVYEYDSRGNLKSCNGVSRQLSFEIQGKDYLSMTDGMKKLEVEHITYTLLNTTGEFYGWEYRDEKGNIDRTIFTSDEDKPIAVYDKDWNIVYSIGGEDYVRNGLFYQCDPEKDSYWSYAWESERDREGLEYLEPGGIDMMQNGISYLYQDVYLPSAATGYFVMGVICGEIYDKTRIISNELGVDCELQPGMNLIVLNMKEPHEDFDLQIHGSAVIKKVFAYDPSVFMQDTDPEVEPEEVPPITKCPCLKCETVDCACRCKSEQDCKCKQCESPVAMTYDDHGNLLSAKRSNHGYDLTQSRTYTDNQDFIKTATDENGVTTNYNYASGSGVLNSNVNSYGAATSYTYDPMGRVIKQSASDGRNTMANEYAYESDRLSKITHNGVSYGFAYDTMGRLLTTTLNSQPLASYAYNRQGNLEKTSFANGQSSTYLYTGDKLTQIDLDNDGKSDYNYSYNSKGELESVYDYVNQTKIVYQDNRFAASSIDGRKLLYSAVGSADNKELTEIVNGQTLKYNTTKTGSNGTVTESIAGSNSALRFSIVNTSDTFKRLAMQKVTLGGTNTSVETSFAYKTNASAGTTGTQTEGVTSTVTTSGGQRRTSGYRYEYDAGGNISKETAVGADGAETGSQQYTYDKLGKLLTETSNTGKKITYKYDASGNLVSKTIKKPGSLFSDTETLTYDAQWKDLLVNYKGQAITHDALGNTTGDGKWNYTWQGGRQLASMSSADSTLSYRYNADGLRTQKTVVTRGVQKTYDYIWANDVLVGMQCGGDALRFLYENGNPVGFLLNESTPYFYIKNLQGDICEIVDGQGESVARYTYDAWGNLLSSEGNEFVLTLNPFTYRGYQYDRETGLYYLQSRYYSPQWCRFINADTNLDTKTSLVGTNVFAYGDNNPVMRTDPTGTITAFNNWLKTSTLDAKYKFIFLGLMQQLMDSVRISPDSLHGVLNGVVKIGDGFTKLVKVIGDAFLGDIPNLVSSGIDLLHSILFFLGDKPKLATGLETGIFSGIISGLNLLLTVSTRVAQGGPFDKIFIKDTAIDVACALTSTFLPVLIPGLGVVGGFLVPKLIPIIVNGVWEILYGTH